MITTNRLRRSAVAMSTLAAVAALALGAAVPTQAAGSDAGLYGAADPTYDGVFRQSLAIMGQTVNGITPPASAVSWLLAQQCSDGSFEAYRADTSVACSKPDPANYTGPDTNSTALALQALMSLDNDRIALSKKQSGSVLDAAERAADYLASAQNSDGGWPYYAGGSSDANSTGVALAAMNSQAPNLDYPRHRKATRFLGTLSASCPQGGGFAYQSGSKVDALSTAQGTLGIVGGLPGYRQPKAQASAPCRATAQAKGLSNLATGIAAAGILPSSMGGPDYTATATAVIALAQARQGRSAIVRGVQALKANAAQYVTPSAGTNPGAAGMLMMVAANTGNRIAGFGGLDLAKTLDASLRK